MRGHRKNQNKSDIGEIIQGLHKSGSTLAATSKCLKVPRSCVQIILHKNTENVQPSSSLRKDVGSLSKRRMRVRWQGLKEEALTQKKTPTFIKAKLISGHKSCVVMKVELLKRKMRISQAWEHHASCVKWWGYFSELQKIKNIIRKCWRDTLRHQPGNVNWGKGRPSDWTTTVSMTSKGLFYKSHHKHLRWIVMVNFWFELYLATQNPCFNEPHLLLKHVIFFSPSFVNVSDDWCEIWMFVTAFTFLCSGCGPGGGEIGGGSALSEGAAPRSSWSEVLLLL